MFKYILKCIIIKDLVLEKIVRQLGRIDKFYMQVFYVDLDIFGDLVYDKFGIYIDEDKLSELFSDDVII